MSPRLHQSKADHDGALRFPCPAFIRGHLHRHRIKDAAGGTAFTIFHAKREGSHLIKEGRGKTLAGQWERSRIERPARPPPHPAASFLYDSTNVRLGFSGTFHEQSA